MGAETCATCSQPANQRCSNCCTTYYCSRDHQKLDWKRHKNRCRSFKVCQNSELGRHLVATRDVRAGEVVLREPPILLGPAQVTPPVCLGCHCALVAGRTVECPHCGWPMCGERCLGAVHHRAECEITARRGKVSISTFAGPHPTYQAVTLLRLVHLRASNPDAWHRLQELEAHDALRRKTPRYDEDVRATRFTKSFFKLDDWSEEELLWALGIIQVNGHEVPLSEPPAVAVYAEASLLEHHCRATCAKSFAEDGALIIRTSAPMARGQHLSICYSDALWGTANRRHHLALTKFFWCQCERCADPTEFGTYFSAVRCESSGCQGYLVPEHPLLDGSPDESDDSKSLWRCGACDKTAGARQVFRVLEDAGRRLAELPRGDQNLCRTFLETEGVRLHPAHYYLTDVRLALAQLLGQGAGGLQGLSDGELADKLRLCHQVLVLVEVLSPAETRVRGLLMFELHAAVAEDARRKANIGAIDPGELRSRLLESKRMLSESIWLLEYEPPSLPEGKIVQQARRNMAEIEQLLRGIHATIGDSPL